MYERLRAILRPRLLRLFAWRQNVPLRAQQAVALLILGLTLHTAGDILVTALRHGTPVLIALGQAMTVSLIMALMLAFIACYVLFVLSEVVPRLIVGARSLGRGVRALWRWLQAVPAWLATTGRRLSDAGDRVEGVFYAIKDSSRTERMNVLVTLLVLSLMGGLFWMDWHVAVHVNHWLPHFMQADDFMGFAVMDMFISLFALIFLLMTFAFALTGFVALTRLRRGRRT